jgi:hypothetical protein
MKVSCTSIGTAVPIQVDGRLDPASRWVHGNPPATASISTGGAPNVIGRYKKGRFHVFAGSHRSAALEQDTGWEVAIWLENNCL